MGCIVFAVQMEYKRIEADYEHVAAYRLVGGCSALGEAAEQRLVDAEGTAIWIAGSLAEVARTQARSAAIRQNILTGGLLDAAELRRRTSELVVTWEQQRGSFLTCVRRGRIELRVSKTLRDYRPDEDIEVVYDEGAARSRLLAADGQRNALVVGEVCAALEADASLVRDGIRFVVEDVEIVPLTFELGTPSVVLSHVVGEDRLRRLRTTLPAIADLEVSDDGALLLRRFEAFEDGREPLPSMANFCLTLLSARAGSRADAAKAYRISKPVLDTLGRLVSTVGDYSTARKAVEQPRAHSPQEKKWIVAVVRAIIRRVCEVNQVPVDALNQVTMDDFSAL